MALSFQDKIIPVNPTVPSSGLSFADKITPVQSIPPVSQNLPTDNFSSQHPILKGISDIIGTTGLGKGIAQSIFLKFTPEGKDLVNQVAQGKMTQQDVEKIIGKTATTKEILGSAAQTALTATTAGIGLPKATTALGKIAETGITIGGLSAAQGAAQAFGEGKPISEIGKEAAISGGIGAILGGGLQTASEALKAFTAPQITQKLYDNAIGVSKTISMAGKSPSVQLIKEGVIGTAKSIFDKQQAIIDRVNPQIDTLLKNNPTKVTSIDVFGKVADAINESVLNEGNEVYTAPEIKKIIQEFLPQAKSLINKEELTLREANRLRQLMDGILGNKAFTATFLPFKKDVLYDVSNAIRNVVQTSEPASKPLFKEWSNAIQASKALNNELNKPHVLRHLISLGEILTGFATGRPLETVTAAGGLEVAQSTLGKTALAVGMNKTNKLLQVADKSIVADLIKKFGTIGIAKSTNQK